MTVCDQKVVHRSKTAMIFLCESCQLLLQTFKKNCGHRKSIFQQLIDHSCYLGAKSYWFAAATPWAIVLLKRFAE